jgi:hypothetical protein
MGRDWARLTPGLQGRLVAFGGVNDSAFAWVDTRPEQVPEQEAAGQLTFLTVPATGHASEAEVGVALIRAERLRQVADEGYTPEHDAEHIDGELARVAAAYALYGGGAGHVVRPGYWPWPDWKLKPGEALDSLVKAGALIAAEIDRIVAEEARRG